MALTHHVLLAGINRVREGFWIGCCLLAMVEVEEVEGEDGKRRNETYHRLANLALLSDFAV